MRKKSRIKAEDILSEENFPEDLMLPSQGNEAIDEYEADVARKIHSLIMSSYNPKDLLPDEKAHLKTRIKNSVRQSTNIKRLSRWAIAASVLIAITIPVARQIVDNRESDLVSFARIIDIDKSDTITRLIIDDGHEIQIGKKESAIKYDNKGESIIIDSGQEITREVKPEKTPLHTVIVPYGKRSEITLSEGTKVWLNSGSKLVYPAVFAGNVREVFVEGEAIFEVTTSGAKPFIVNTRDFNIKVLGTVFNVCAYPDDKHSSAILEKGKIELSNNNHNFFSKIKTELAPGMAAVFDPDKNNFDRQHVNTRTYLSWRDGYLTFESEKLGNIMKKLSRYYNVDIILHNDRLANETFSGNLDLKNTPGEVLSTITQIVPFTIDYKDDKIIIN